VRFLLITAAAAVALAGQTPGIWLDVPFVRQPADGCGAASLAMLATYWQDHHAAVRTPDAALIQRELYVPSARGIPAAAMVAYLKKNGFRAFAFSGEWSDLQHHLALGRPLIVAIKAGGDSLHYAVVAGLSETTVALNDPSDRKLRLYDREDFEQKWNATDHWTLLAVPQSGR
jgi:ABC-type bacteriocin/lantibiotic exporter with double-glycine peptidase domain